MSPPGPAATIHTPHHCLSCNAAYNKVSPVSFASCDGIVPVRWFSPRDLHNIEGGRERKERGKGKQGETNESTGPCSHHPHPAHSLSCNAAYNKVSAVISANCDGIVPVRWLAARLLHSIKGGGGGEGETDESTGPCSHHPPTPYHVTWLMQRCLPMGEPRQLEERCRERAHETLLVHVQACDAAVRALDMVSPPLVIKGAVAGIRHRRRTLGEERGREVRVAAEVLPCAAVAGREIRRAACANARVRVATPRPVVRVAIVLCQVLVADAIARKASQGATS
jgi:hypothetical protein